MVTVTNGRGQPRDIITTTSTSYVIVSNTNSECEPVAASVVAVTSVGNSPFSDSITGGFARGKDSNVSILLV